MFQSWNCFQLVFTVQMSTIVSVESGDPSECRWKQAKVLIPNFLCSSSVWTDILHQIFYIFSAQFIELNEDLHGKRDKEWKVAIFLWRREASELVFCFPFQIKRTGVKCSACSEKSTCPVLNFKKIKREREISSTQWDDDTSRKPDSLCTPAQDHEEQCGRWKNLLAYPVCG